MLILKSTQSAYKCSVQTSSKATSVNLQFYSKYSQNTVQCWRYNNVNYIYIICHVCINMFLFHHHTIVIYSLLLLLLLDNGVILGCYCEGIDMATDLQLSFELYSHLLNFACTNICLVQAVDGSIPDPCSLYVKVSLIKILNLNASSSVYECVSIVIALDEQVPLPQHVNGD